MFGPLVLGRRPAARRGFQSSTLLRPSDPLFSIRRRLLRINIRALFVVVEEGAAR
jgi:hypothetical protein